MGKGRDPPPFGQCPNRPDLFQTGASLRSLGTNRLEVPRRMDQEVSLESVNLDEIGEEQEKLEKFLNEDCPGVDPLPQD